MAAADSSGPAAGPSNGECCAQDAGAARASAPAVQQPGPPSSHAAAAAGGEDPSQPSQSSAADGSTDTTGPATSSNDGGSGSSSAGGGAAAAGGGSPRGSAFAQTPPDDAECRICLLPEPAGLVEPCSCTGTLRYAHLGCLVRWCKERVSTHCEICGAQYRQELLPMLEETVKAQRQQQERLAELQRDVLRRAEVEGAEGQAQVSPERGVRANRWMLLKVILVLVVTGGLLYGIFFLGSQNGGATWASILLRCLIFLIPLYLIYRGITACLSYRGGVTLRPPEDPDERRSPFAITM